MTNVATIRDARTQEGPARITRSIGETVEQIIEGLFLSEGDLAAVLQVDRRTLARWRHGGAVPQRAARQRLEQLAALGLHLRDTFDDPAIAPWLRSENRYLGGLTPLEALRAGRPDRIEAALEVIDSGIFL